MKKLWILGLMTFSFLYSEPGIVIQVEKNVKEIAQTAYEIFEKELKNALQETKTPVFILPTGSTPLPFYQKIVQNFYDEKIDLSEVYIFNLDEYIGLHPNDSQSYSYYLRHYLLNFLERGINLEKLKKIGIRELTIKDHKNKKQREKINKALLTFSDLLLKAKLDQASAKEVLDDCLNQTYKLHPHFKSFTSKVFNSKILPSLHELEKKLQLEKRLFSKGLKEEHIFLLRGDKDLKDTYHLFFKESLNSFLEASTTCVICFAGIGEDPSHIAFNDLINEPPFDSRDLCDEAKISLAKQTSLRSVYLSKTTRQINSRFFFNVLEQVPQKALTLGFNEILRCDRIIILVSGSAKLNAIYQTFEGKVSFKTPSSLLREAKQNQVTFILDESCYGVGKKKSLFELIHLKASKDTPFELTENTLNTCSLWDVPLKKMPSLLNLKKQLDSIPCQKATLPSEKKILWIQEDKKHYILLHQLKKNKNEIKITSFKPNQELLKLVTTYQPQLIFFPYSNTSIKFVETLKKDSFIQDSKEHLLGIYYDCNYSLANVFYPLDKSEIKKKTFALKNYHLSQSKRLPYELIALKMGELKDSRIYYGESFVFYSLIPQNFTVEKKPSTKKEIITKKTSWFLRKKKNLSWSFLESDQVIAISPHPDDIEIGLGGLSQHLVSKGTDFHVLFASNGHLAEIELEDVKNHPHLSQELLECIKKEKTRYLRNHKLKGQVRLEEAKKSLQFLNPKVHLHFESFPFYSLKKLTQKDEEKAYSFLEKEINPEKKRSFIFLPYPLDQHLTHCLTQTLFENVLKRYCLNHPNLDLYLVYYMTPWTGQWNLYHYSQKEGKKLFGLVGSELLVGHGKKGIPFTSLGSKRANRYQVFYFKN